MSLYPSLEDMKVHQLQQAETNIIQQQQLYHQAQLSRRISEDHSLGYVQPPPTAPTNDASLTLDSVISAYPSLMDEYMGLRLEPPSGPVPPSNQQTQVALPGNTTVAVNAPSAPTTGGIIAPLSGSDVGLKRAHVTHGVREVLLCKDEKGKCGMRLRAINKGIFVQCVTANSPAAMANVRFGDQILQINGENVAGYSDDKAMTIIKKANPQRIILAIRDRPFERTITLHKDSTGHVGFMYKKGRINSIAKDSSAARNGLLTDHQILEVGGQNVVGMKDDDITKVIDGVGQIVTLTLMPSQIYDHMVKHMASGLVSKFMDHSIPEI